MSDREFLFFAALMGGLVTSLLLSSLYLWRAPHPIQVAKVDIQSLIKQQAGQLFEQHLSKKDEQIALTRVMMRLKKVLANQESNLILLDGSIVLSAQVPDMTDTIRQQLRDPEEGQRRGNGP